MARRFAAVCADAIFLALYIALLLFGFARAEKSETPDVIHFLLMGAGIVLFTIGFFWGLANGQTLGKAFLDLRVIDKRNGQIPGFGRMLLRETVAKWVSGFFFSLGFLWAIWDRDGQAWHDKIAGTVVILEHWTAIIGDDRPHRDRRWCLLSIAGLVSLLLACAIPSSSSLGGSLRTFTNSAINRASSLTGAEPKQTESNAWHGEQQFPRFTIANGEADTDGLPTSGVKLCVLGRRDICFQMPSATAPNSPELTYQFGLTPRSERLPLPGGGSWVFFSGLFSGGGSGTLERISILRYSQSSGIGKITNLMPYISLTNVSDRAMWNVPSASAYPILVDADFIWSEGESHFEPHFFTVEAWRFDPKADQYTRAVSYHTSRKYDGGNAQTVRVLAPERAEILRRLAEASTRGL